MNSGQYSTTCYETSLCAVQGIAKGIQWKLLAELSLTSDKAIETALAAEAADKDSLRLTIRDNNQTTPDQAPPAAPMNKVEPQKPRRIRLLLILRKVW